MRWLFHTIFYQPLYNALVWLAAVLPGQSVGLAIIVLTLVVRIALFPLQHSLSRSQHKMRELDGQIKAIRDQHQKDKAEQARRIMELYRQHGINPFAGFIVVLIQLPVLLALYWVAQGSLAPDNGLLYSFVAHPASLNTLFLGFIDLTSRSYLFALLVGVSQFGQMWLVMPPLPAPAANEPSDLKAELSRSMNRQMRYVMPVMIFLIASRLPTAVSLYWLTGNLFSIAHEWYVRRRATPTKVDNSL